MNFFERGAPRPFQKNHIAAAKAVAIHEISKVKN
jgi:hypothetical protein